MDRQAALEQAVCDRILAAGLGYVADTCARCFDGMPPPRCGNVFVSVWSGGRRTPGKGSRQAIDQYHSVSVTVTIRTVQPYDRKVKHRDDLGRRLDAIIAAVDPDSLDFRIRNAANVLGEMRNPASGTAVQPVGFVEALYWAQTDDARTVDGGWFWASTPSKESGVTQTAHFRGARHIQYQATAQ